MVKSTKKAPNPHAVKIRKVINNGLKQLENKPDCIRFDFGNHFLQLCKDPNGYYTIPTVIPK
jgi:hypothetical protein